MDNKRIATCLLTLAAAGLAAPSRAQVESTVNIEEIVVTAAKRESTLQEIPVAVSVVQAQDIKESQVLDIKDLQFLVPSLRVTQLQSSGNTNFLIRGFGNGANNAGIEPSVGVFIDGVYRSRTASALADLPNLERIEVLRGPQSTLFGKNASAGVISVITAKPSLDETTGSVSVTGGDYDQLIVKADVNGPVSDWVGFGLSANFNQRDGYYENLAGGDALNELNRWGARGELYFLPSDTLEVRVIADVDDLDEACCGVANLLNGPTGNAVVAIGGALVPEQPFAYEGYYDFTPVNEFRTEGLSMQVDWDMNDAVTLTSITALRSLSRNDNVDVDFTSARLVDSQTANRTDTEIDTFTQELRLSGATDAMTWMVGAFFFDEKVDQFTGVKWGQDMRAYADFLAIGAANESTAENNVARADAGLPPEPFLIPGVDPSPLDDIEDGLTGLFLAGLPSLGGVIDRGTFYGAGQGLTELSSMDNQALSLFAQFDIDLGDRATLTLGANYTEDEKKVIFDSTQTDVFAGLDLVDVGGLFIFAEAFQTALLGGVPGIPAGNQAAAGAYASAASAAVAPLECPSPQTYPDETPCNPLLAFQPFQFLPPNVDFPNAVESGRTKDDDVTWTARLSFDVTDNVNVYLGAGTGFKASSWNLSRDSRPFPSDQAALEAAGLTVPNLEYTTRYALPEEATVYEIGLKGSWDTIALNIAVFDQEIKNFQENIFTGTGFNLQNAGKQSTEGVEIDIRWAPSDFFEGTLAATIMDPVYDSFEEAESVDDDPTSDDFLDGITEDISGQQVPGVHEVSLTAAARFNFQVGNASGFLRAEYIYEDEIRVIQNTPAFVASREVNTVNASLGLAWDNGFEAMLWGRNLTDDEYLMSAFPAVAQDGSFSGYPNPPRTYGLTVRKYFD